MSLCKCTHDSELHELGDIGFIDGAAQGEVRLKWRWVCSGEFSQTAFFPIPCPCSNFELKAEIPK